MSDNFINYLLHIRDECRYILSVTGQDLTYQKMTEDETIKRALVRSLEIIGEAGKKVPADIKLQWKEIEWKQIAGMRDRLIHDYVGINYRIVWDVVINKIPVLLQQIEKVIAQEKK